MRVAVIGGTGFVGSYILDELIGQSHEPVLLVRPGSEGKVRHKELCTLVTGEVQDAAAVRRTVSDCAAVIYLVGILREQPGKGITFEEMHYKGAVRAIDLAAETGAGRFVLMSANGVKPYGTPYQSTKYRAEQHLRGTNLDWTIFRPSVMYGPPRGRMEFASQLYDQMIRPPLPAPLFFDGLLPTAAGTFRIAPVHIKDVAAVVVKSLENPKTYKQTYGLCGPEALEWRDIIRLLARAVGKEKLTVPVPVLGIKGAAAMLEQFDFFPVTRDQIVMLMEGNTCDSTEVFDLFQITPGRFNADSLAYLKDR
ncbi:MAG: NAD(P)H-binding protein [Pseudomonadota bacterium]|nr:NAD(P)H-binding protein [Pseudomonadota bacterium]